MNELHLSETAQADLAAIKAYIANDLENPAAALNTMRKITKELRLLREHALLGAALSAVAYAEERYRVLVIGNYLAFYRIQGSEVYIDRILYGRRDYLSILFGEMLDETEEG